MPKIKYRKCHECGGKMQVRKSGKGTKFWGCTTWKDTGCNGSAEYHGGGARAGLNLTIREIENGYIVTTASPYAGIDDDPVERYVEDLSNLESVLRETFEAQAPFLCKEIENSTEFTEEIDAAKHEKRVEVVKRGTTNVQELLDRMAAAKKKADAGETVD